MYRKATQRGGGLRQMEGGGWRGDENWDQYVENLRKISDAKDREHWIIYFLEAITTQAKRNSEIANQVLSLYNTMRTKIVNISKSPHAMKVLDALFMIPIIRPPTFRKISGLEPKGAHRIIVKLKDEKVLKTTQKHASETQG